MSVLLKLGILIVLCALLVATFRLVMNLIEKIVDMSAKIQSIPDADTSQAKAESPVKVEQKAA